MTMKDGDVNGKIITLRGEKVILDSDVAMLYGVETREVNQAVKNNPDKFPKKYIIELKPSEFYELQSKILTANAGEQDEALESKIATFKKTRALPKAFTEKGLYMLATILKSPQATKTTIDIIEAFAKLRELARTVAELSETTEEFKQKSLYGKRRRHHRRPAQQRPQNYGRRNEHRTQLRRAET